MSLSPNTTATNTGRVPLPEVGEHFVTDAGLETELVFVDKIELPEFCAGVLLETPEGRSRLRGYYQEFIELAKQHGCGVIIETPTWRLNADWVEKLGYDKSDHRRLNFAAVQLLQDLRSATVMPSSRFVISGNLGPRYDGYKADQLMTTNDAAEYHSEQIELLREAGADCICAMTITNSSEAIGIASAAKKCGMPTVISFTLETDGRLPSGETLQDAIALVDSQVPNAVNYFGINCAHPTHFEEILNTQEDWIQRIGSIRANASRMSHQELDNSPTLDEGDPADLGQRYRQLQTMLPDLRVFGGCCGTDKRHITSICESCLC